MTTNTDKDSALPIQHTAGSVADAALKIVRSWRDNDDVPAGLVTEIEELVSSVRNPGVIRTEKSDPRYVDLVAEWLFNRNSDEPEWETWSELLGSERQSGRARDLVARWRSRANAAILNQVPANPFTITDSAIDALARIIFVAASPTSNYQHYSKTSSDSVTSHLANTVIAWAHQWSAPDELKDKMIRLVVDKVESPEMLARLDGGLSTDLNSILRDRILGFHATSVLRDHNARRSNIETPDGGN